MDGTRTAHSHAGSPSHSRRHSLRGVSSSVTCGIPHVVVLHSNGIYYHAQKRLRKPWDRDGEWGCYAKMSEHTIAHFSSGNASL